MKHRLTFYHHRAWSLRTQGLWRWDRWHRKLDGNILVNDYKHTLRQGVHLADYHGTTNREGSNNRRFRRHLAETAQARAQDRRNTITWPDYAL